ncbi:MAG: M23 family metallopeptidase [Clostridia bacterium]|nr:M23 family metallopeptidase [Clostridia bacterium]
MRMNTDYRAIGKGLYKIVFSLCIIVLCIITVVITGNYNRASTTDLRIDESENDTVSEYEFETQKNEDDKIDDNISNPNSSSASKTDTETDMIYEPDFSPPTMGEISKDFSNDIPLYSKTMDDWRNHQGIDILCSYGTEIISCEKGTVTDVGYDMLYGNYVEVSINDFVLRYSSLDSGIKYVVGDEINKGDVIGYLSDSCVIEICDEPHLHFEMKKSGEYVDPREYIY